MTVEENKAIVRRFFEEGLNQRNLDTIDEIFAADSVYHTTAYPDFLGPEGFKEFLTGHLAPFPDGHYTVEDTVAEGDQVATRWTFTATHQGEVMGIAPTGKQVTVIGISILRIVSGKIGVGWTEWDVPGLTQQITTAAQEQGGK